MGNKVVSTLLILSVGLFRCLPGCTCLWGEGKRGAML